MSGDFFFWALFTYALLLVFEFSYLFVYYKLILKTNQKNKTKNFKEAPSCAVVLGGKSFQVSRPPVRVPEPPLPCRAGPWASPVRLSLPGGGEAPAVR